MRKIPHLFVIGDNGLYSTTVTPGCEWVIEGEGIPTRQWDGEPIEISAKGNIVGATAGQKKRAAAAMTSARAHAAALRVEHDGRHQVPDPFQPGTYELTPDGQLHAHGDIQLMNLTRRDYWGLQSFLHHHVSNIEGVVFWRELGDPAAGMVKAQTVHFPAL